MPTLTSLLRSLTGLRSISLIAAGNLAGQVIVVGSAPLLSRLYAPADFGVFATIVAAATLGAVLTPLSLHQAIHVPTDPAVVARLVRASLRLALGGAALCLVPALVLVQTTKVSTWSLAPVTLAAAACADILTYWATREGLFRVLVQARLAGAILGVAGMVLLSRWHAMGLLAGHTLGACASALWLAWRFRNLAPTTGPVAVTTLLREYRYFPLWRLPATLLNTAVVQMPLWMFTQVFGPAIVGQFSMTQRVFNAPVTLLGSAIGDVFQREAGQALRTRRECRAEFGRFGLLLLGIGAVIAGMVGLFGPVLFAWVFGEPWREAGELARWLAPLFVLRFVFSPLSALLILGARPGLDLLLQLWLLAGNALAWWLAVRSESLPTTIIALTAASAVFYAGSTFVAWRIATARLPVGATHQPAPA